MFAQKYQKELMAMLPFLQPQEQQNQNTTNLNKTSSNRQFSIDLKDDIQSGQASGQFTPNYNFIQDDIIKISAASEPNLPIKYQTDEDLVSQSNDQSSNNNERYQIMRNKPISQCENLFFGQIIQKPKPIINQQLLCETIGHAKSFTYYQSDLNEKKQLNSPFKKQAQKSKELSIQTKLLTKLPKLNKLKLASIQSTVQNAQIQLLSDQKYKSTWKTLANQLKKLTFFNFQQLASQLTLFQNKISQQNKEFYNKLKIINNKKQQINSVLKQSLNKWNKNKKEVQDYQKFKYQKLNLKQIDKVQKQIDKNHHKFTQILNTKIQQSNLLLIRNKRLTIMQINKNTKLFQKYINQIDNQFKRLIQIQQKQLQQLDQNFNQEFKLLQNQLFQLKSHSKTNQSQIMSKFVQIDKKINKIYKQQYDQGKNVQNSIVELMNSLINKLQKL